MADTWAGPANLVKIIGTPDDLSLVESSYGEGKKRVALSLVDVTLVNDDGSEVTLDAKTLYFSPDGAPGQEFAASVRKALGVKVGQDIVAPLLAAGKTVFKVTHKEFKNEKKGISGTMDIYTVDSNAPEAAPVVALSEGEILMMLNGKTPAEVSRNRAAFAGWADVLVSRTKVIAKFGDKVSLADGRYVVAS